MPESVNGAENNVSGTAAADAVSASQPSVAGRTTPTSGSSPTASSTIGKGRIQQKTRSNSSRSRLRRFLGPRQQSRNNSANGRESDNSNTIPSSPSPDKTEASTPPTSPDEALAAECPLEADQESAPTAVSIEAGSSNNNSAGGEEETPAGAAARDATTIMNESDNICPPIPTDSSVTGEDQPKAENTESGGGGGGGTQTASGVSPDEKGDGQQQAVVAVAVASDDDAIEKRKGQTEQHVGEDTKEEASRSSFTSLVRKSEIFQKSLLARRQSGSRSLGGAPNRRLRTSRRSRKGNSNSSSNSLGGNSVQSRRSTASTLSVMSVESTLPLSEKVQSMLELAANVVNAEGTEEASVNYQKAIHAAGLEIMEINKQMGQLKGDDASDSRSLKKNTYHEDLRLIGIIIGLLRTKMAIVYTEGGEYDRAVELCKGANQVHKHQPALKLVNQRFEHAGDQIGGLMVVIIERLEKAQICLEQHRQLLNKIDLHSVGVDDDLYDDDICVLTSKEIVFSMIEGVATDDGSIVTYQGDDTLELLSVHAAEQDKHDQAINYLRDALQVQLVAMGTKQPRVTQSLIRVANMYRGTGNDRKNEGFVLGCFEQTASVLRHSSLGSRARGSVLNDIAVIHMRRRDYDEAIKFLLDALRAYDEEDVHVEEGREIKASITTLHVWRNLGDCYMELGQSRSAEGAFLKSLDIQTEARRIQMAATELNLSIIGLDKSLLPLINDAHITDTICRVGKARAASGDHKRALEIYQEALTVVNRDSTPSPDQTAKELLEKSDQLCNAIYCIAESCCALDNFEKALRMFNLSISLRNSGGAFKNDKRKSSRVHCVMCFVGIGNVYARAKEYPLALKQYKEALSFALASRIKEDHPIVLSLDQRLKEVTRNMKGDDTSEPGSSPLTTLERKADDEIERGALDSATETLKELLVLRRAALQDAKEKGQDSSDQVYAIACLLQTFGFVFAKNGDDENAERAFKDAARLFKKRAGNMRVEV